MSDYSKTLDQLATFLENDHEKILNTIGSWGGDISRQDAEDILSELCFRWSSHPEQAPKDLTFGMLVYSLRQMKENWRKRKMAGIRGGNCIHESVSQLEENGIELPCPTDDEPGAYVAIRQPQLITALRHIECACTSTRQRLLAGKLIEWLQAPERSEDYRDVFSDEDIEAFMGRHNPTQEEFHAQISRALYEIKQSVAKKRARQEIRWTSAA